MRVTLDELKAMDLKQIREHWWASIFPFDGASCHHCLTSHAVSTDFTGCDDEHHAEFRKRAFEFWDKPRGCDIAVYLHDNIEEFYALRLFYDSLYPQPIDEMPYKPVLEPEEQVVY